VPDTTTPLFTNDAFGVIRYMVVTFIPIGLPLIGWLYWQSKRGGDSAAKELSDDVTGIGKKVDDMKQQGIEDRAEMRAFDRRLIHIEEVTTALSREQAALERAEMDLEKQLVGLQTEITQLILATSREQTEAVHRLAIEVAKLGERADVTDCFENLGKQLESAINRIHSPVPHSHRAGDPRQ
jgi:predicted negative regulator of RcsB-dependent stress response